MHLPTTSTALPKASPSPAWTQSEDVTSLRTNEMSTEHFADASMEMSADVRALMLSPITWTNPPHRQKMEQRILALDKTNCGCLRQNSPAVLEDDDEHHIVGEVEAQVERYEQRCSSAVVWWHDGHANVGRSIDNTRPDGRRAAR